MLTHGIPPDFRDGVHIYRQPPSGQSQSYRFTHLPTDGVHYREPTGPGAVVLKAVPVTGAASSGFTVDQTIYEPLYSHTHCWYVVDICDTAHIGGGTKDEVIQQVLGQVKHAKKHTVVVGTRRIL